MTNKPNLHQIEAEVEVLNKARKARGQPKLMIGARVPLHTVVSVLHGCLKAAESEQSIHGPEKEVILDSDTIFVLQSILNFHPDKLAATFLKHDIDDIRTHEIDWGPEEKSE